jgi:hypothetical protein
MLVRETSPLLKLTIERTLILHTWIGISLTFSSIGAMVVGLIGRPAQELHLQIAVFLLLNLLILNSGRKRETFAVASTTSKPLLTLSTVLLAILSLSVSPIIDRYFELQILSNSDGVWHLGSLNAFVDATSFGLFPFQRIASGELVQLSNVYPTGSYLPVLTIHQLFDVGIDTTYNYFYLYLTFLCIPATVALIVQRAVASSFGAVVFVFAFSVVCTPDPQKAHLPHVFGIVAAFGLVYLTVSRRFPVRAPHTLLCLSALVFIHPTACAIFTITYAFVHQKSVIKYYGALLIVASMFYLAVRTSIGIADYWKTWISVNVRPEVTLNEIEPSRYLQFIKFVVGMGTRWPILGSLIVLSLLPVFRWASKIDLKNLMVFVLILLTSAFSGISTLGSVVGALSFPFYGVPQRIISQLPILFIITAARSWKLRSLKLQ